MSEIEQKNTFLLGEGNQWYNRNKDSIINKNSDVVVEVIQNRQLKPTSILEIGCSNGWRLNILFSIFNCECYGIDPSLQAIEEGKNSYPNLNLKQGTADEIPFTGKTFDLIIFGFCLYLCDRKDLFKITFEADKYLRESGSIIIYDFEPSFPYKNKYQYVEGIYSYKMDYSQLFLSNPSYFLISKNIFTHYGLSKIEDPNERVSVTILQKNNAKAYIVNPF